MFPFSFLFFHNNNNNNLKNDDKRAKGLFSKQLEGGGVASGGLRELIPCIARTAVAVGVDGLFMEVQYHNLLEWIIFLPSSLRLMVLVA